MDSINHPETRMNNGFTTLFSVNEIGKTMKRSKFTEEQVAYVLRQAESDTRIYTETAVGHDRIALLQNPLKKGRITKRIEA